MESLPLYWKCCKKICSFKYFGDLFCSTQCVRRLWSHLVLMSTFQMKYYCIHFVDEKLNIINICIFFTHIGTQCNWTSIVTYIWKIHQQISWVWSVLNMSFWCLWNAWCIVDGQHIFFYMYKWIMHLTVETKWMVGLYYPTISF